MQEILTKLYCLTGRRREWQAADLRQGCVWSGALEWMTNGSSWQAGTSSLNSLLYLTETFSRSSALQSQINLLLLRGLKLMLLLPT